MKIPQLSNNVEAGWRSCFRVAVAFPVVSSVAVSGLAFLVSGAAWRSLLRTGNPNVGFVVAAFLVLGAKNLLKAMLLLGGGVSLPWEIAFGVADVAMVGLIAWPLLAPRRPRP